MVLRCMSAARMDHNADGLLIRQLVFQKNYNTYVLGNKGISYYILGVEKSFWKLSRLWVTTPNFLGYTVLGLVGQPLP